MLKSVQVVYVVVYLLLSIMFITSVPAAIAATSTRTRPHADTDGSDTDTIQRWDAISLEKVCSGNISSTRICDPNHFLTSTTSTSTSAEEEEEEDDDDDISAITTALHKLETNHTLQCDDNQISTEIQMAIVIVNSIQLKGGDYDYKLNQAKKLTRTLHDKWGVGNTACLGSGIVLFLSIQDRLIYISAGKGLLQILSTDRIDHIIQEMKPFLKEQEYAKAIVNAIHYIIHYVDKGPSSFFMLYHQYFIVGFIILFTLGRGKWNQRKKTEYVRVKTQLTQLDRDRALALMGKYECRSCPICLEDFHDSNAISESEDNNNDNSNSNSIGAGTSNKNSNPLPELGSDRKPITLLRCGHTFDRTCWEEWISTPSCNIHQCPICKQDIGGAVSPPPTPPTPPTPSTFTQRRSVHSEQQEPDTIRQEDEQQPFISNSYRSSFTRRQQRDMYQTERHFRLNRLRVRYPYYIQQSHIDRWTRDNYDGTMVQDSDFVSRDPTTIVHQNGSNHTSGDNHHSSDTFGSFGGGSSGGGGGGHW